MKRLEEPIVIDVEASGFGNGSYPIEIGVALEKGKKYCSLILPADDWIHWDNGAESVHGISRDILKENGKPIIDVARELNRLLKSKTVYSDGWVVDKPWILKLYNRCNIEPEFYTSPLEMILSEPQMNVWHETKDKILEEMNLQRHRASNDAFIIQQTWIRTHQQEK